jgi:hypothetical protein
MTTDDPMRYRVRAALRAQEPAKEKKGKKTYPLLPSGHPIHFRKTQKLAWGLMAGVLGVGFIAGLYFLGLQIDWHNVFPFVPRGTSAKAWWDNGMGFITSPNWKNGIWRHGVRDKAEPEVWAIVGGILLGASLSRHVIKLPLLVLGGLLMFAAVIAGALLITWFINFGPGKHLNNAHNWQDFVLGFLIGHAIHYAWMPMANSIRYQLVSFKLHRTTDVPVWVRLPLAPPGWRDMWSLLKAEGVGPVSLKKKEDKYKQSRYVVPLLVLIFLLIAVVGILAKYPIAHGVHIPVLNP